MSKKIVQIIANAGLAINNSLQNEELQPMLMSCIERYITDFGMWKIVAN